MAAVMICSDFGAQENKICTASTFHPSVCHEVIGPDVTILVFWMLIFKPDFKLSFFIFIKRLSSSSLFSVICEWRLNIWQIKWQTQPYPVTRKWEKYFNLVQKRCLKIVHWYELKWIVKRNKWIWPMVPKEMTYRCEIQGQYLEAWRSNPFKDETNCKLSI